MNIIERWEENHVTVSITELNDFHTEQWSLFQKAYKSNDDRAKRIHSALAQFAIEAIKGTNEGDQAALRQLKAYRAAKEG